MRRLEQVQFAEPTEAKPFEGGPLVVHCRPAPANARGIVIFVHGLGGVAYGPRSTWGYFPRFLFEDFEDLHVGIYFYRTAGGRLKFWTSITVEEEATVFAHLLRDLAEYESVVLIGHSMGGLLCEAAIAHLIETRQTEPVRRIRGLVLMATPQAGSLRVPWVVRWLKDFAALKPHGQLVQRIHQTLNNYVALADGDDNKPFRIPTWAILGANDFWVDRLSSRFNLPDSRIKVVRASHTSLVKPSSKQDDAYRFVRECVRVSLAAVSAPGRRPATPERPKLVVGRAGALARTIELLALSEQSPAMITAALISAPGQGQTTLAAALAEHIDVQRALPDGTLWVTLGDTPDIMTALSAWGRQLGADIAPYDSPHVRSLALRLLLANRRKLLVLDDVTRAEHAAPFLAGGPGCRALVTTRDAAVAQALAGERCLNLERLAPADSIELLRLVAPNALVGKDAQARWLAEALEGSPFDLNLVGRVLEQSESHSPLMDELEALRKPETGGTSSGPLRQAVLRYAYASLSEEARRMFRRLAVFGSRPQTFSAEAAAAVCGAGGAQLDQLVRLGLAGRASAGRYLLASAVSKFAEELLEAGGETHDARERHARFYLDFALKHVERDWDRVEEELDQIGRAFAGAAGLRDRALVIALARAMTPFLIHRGLLDEARRWIDVALEGAHAARDSGAEAFLLRMKGRVYWQKGRKTSALDAFERCQGLCESTGNQRELLRVLLSIGVVRQSRQEWDAALGSYERAAALASQAGEKLKLGQALRGVGLMRHKLGDRTAAFAEYARSAAVLDELGPRGPHRADLAQTLANVAELHAESNELQQALEYHERALAIREEAGDHSAAAQSHIGAGEVCSKLGDLEQAQRHYEASLKICQEMADIQGISTSLNRVADVLAKKQQAGAAETYRAESRRITTALMETQDLARAAAGDG